jgi:predicted GIY-YIG superfamily endonuclease
MAARCWFGMSSMRQWKAAILREKQIKAGSRIKKLALIEASNPQWKDLYNDIH